MTPKIAINKRSYRSHAVKKYTDFTITAYCREMCSMGAFLFDRTEEDVITCENCLREMRKGEL